MIPHHGELRRVIVYDGQGSAIVERVHVPEPPDSPRPTAGAQLRHLMSNEVVCATPDLTIASLAGLMVRQHIGSVPVVDRVGRAIGMVTKSDLIDHLHVGGRGKRVRDIMMPLALSLPDTATVVQAAALMAAEDVHHVIVLDDNNLLAGIISSMDIVRWIANQASDARTPS